MASLNSYLLRLRPFLREHTQLRWRRRTLTRPSWLPPEQEEIVKFLNVEDRALMERVLRAELVPQQSNYVVSTTESEAIDHLTGEYVPGETRRVGLVGKKAKGRYSSVVHNASLSREPCHLGDRPGHMVQKFSAWQEEGFWEVIVGAFDTESVFYSPEWRSLFARAGVPTKECIGSFPISENAVVTPGTKLDVRHFQVGQYLTVSGKTVDFGFQGVMHRWGMKGQPKLHTTKSHRRVGSIGVKGEAKVWPGRALPGHMGYEWRHATGLEVIRINPITQVIYVKGCVPGDQMEILHIKDCMTGEKCVQQPPFPTYIADEKEFDALKIGDNGGVPTHLLTTKDIYAPNVFQLNMPSILFTEADETKSLVRDKTRAKIAKAKK